MPPNITTSTILSGLNEALPIIETVVETAFPGVGSLAATAVKIAQGVIAGVPEAISLYEQFQSGTIPTDAQLAAYESSEDAAYAKLMADITAKLS